MPLPISGTVHEAPAATADFVWFIYGSSLDRDAFATWAREHDCALPDFSRAFAARLEGWRLSFDVASRYWGGAVGSLAATTGAVTEGLALPMPGSARGLADHKEGAASGLYVPVEVAVTPLRGGTAVAAIAYIASPSRRLGSEAAPAAAWLESVIRGGRAAGLSAQWIDGLEALHRSGDAAGEGRPGS
jgi:gamma-glutamylcyclotransferase